MIELFTDKKDCCGCTACMSICPQYAISMQPDEEGFLYPQIKKELCVECGICKCVCAFQNGYRTSNIFDEPIVYATKYKSDEVRKNSSSGGMFTAISDYVLSQKGVIYGAAFDESLSVTHQRGESVKERNRMRGSKYIQSDIKNVLKQVKNDLDSSKPVLFTGTGCQIVGLYSYLKSTNTNIDGLITVDIICHGVSSPRIFADYIAYCQEKNKSKIIGYYFRSKVKGWGHTEEAIYENGKHDYSSTLSQAFKELFYSNFCLRPSCHNCKYTNFKRSSDITIADYWGVENFFPEFKDNLGVSATIINTVTGKSVLLCIQENIDCIKSNIKDCAVKQCNLYKPTPQNPRKDEFWQEYYNKGFNYVIKRYTGFGFLNKIKSLIVKVLQRLRILLMVKKMLKVKL